MTSRRLLLKTIALTLAGGAAAFALPKQRRRERPNIIFVMLDDLGKEWVGCYGSREGLTPNADRLAAEGMTFENAYAMPLCVPTRTTLLSGQYPARHGWTINWNVPLYGTGYFDPDYYPSLARVLKQAGYATAVAGKWQVNDFRVQPDVLSQFGFDDYCMWTGIERENQRRSHSRYWDPHVHTKDGSGIRQHQFGEDVFASFLVDFIRENQRRPFMLYYPMCLPHAPLVATPLDRHAAWPREQLRAMIRYADVKLGELLQALEALDLRHRTIVIWTSDNGSPTEYTAVSGGNLMAGGKGTLKERGINVPFIVSCPGLVPAGVTTDALIDFTDLLPTFAELAQGQPASAATLDGRSFARHLLGRERDGPRRWILSMDHTRAKLSPDGRLKSASPYAQRVVRDKRYKLWIDGDRRSWKLVDLAADPEETDNLIESGEPGHRRARARLRRVIRNRFAPRDAAPSYDPLPKQPWDLPADEAIRRFNQSQED
jgi:arylsulfatase A-like enzyme